MRSWSFLLSRRWVLFALAVVGIGYAAWWLGGWQFGRLHDTRALNSIVRTNEHRDPTPAEQVLAVGRPARSQDQWRVVSATGTYRPEKTIVVRYQTRDGSSGVDLVVPLVLDDGNALLVDRGWFPADNGDQVDLADIPAPPGGPVAVSGYVRQDGTGKSTRVDALSTRAISSSAIGPAIGVPTLGGFVDLRSETPGPAAGQTSLGAVELPELDDGPHFFYGLQWWFFGVLATFGFFYLMYDEWRRGPRPLRTVVSSARTSAAPPSGDRSDVPAGAVMTATRPAVPRTRKEAHRAATEAGLVKARAEKAAKRAALVAADPARAEKAARRAAIDAGLEQVRQEKLARRAAEAETRVR